ncbi:MAG: hypothetical protein ACFCU8_15590 [Thermosynechococcaceae cyanobacterium]
MTKTRLAWATPQMLLERLKYLRQEMEALEVLICQVLSDHADTVTELESLVDPYSDSGAPICNTYREYGEADD